MALLLMTFVHRDGIGESPSVAPSCPWLSEKEQRACHHRAPLHLSIRQDTARLDDEPGLHGAYLLSYGV